MTRPGFDESDGETDELRVLVVDGHDDVHDGLARTLAETGYRPNVDRVATATAALSTLDEAGYDAIVVGDELPDGELNGLELLARLGGNERPVVFVAEYQAGDVIDRAVDRGANRCLPRGTGSPGWYRLLANAVVTEVENHRTLVALEQTREELRRIHDTVPVMITRKDTENRLLTVNDAVTTYLGLPREEIEGKTAWELFPAYGDEFYEMDRRVIDSGEPIRGEIQRFSTPTGEDLWMKTDALPYTDEHGEVDGVLVVSEDITELIEREQELARQNERLSAFTSVVSHDLRNPLNVAQGRLALARETCSSDHLAAVEDAHERIEVLIEKLLALARERDTVTETESVELSSVVDAAWTNVETHNATLVTDVDRTLQADESRLLQVFENLFRNAVEHGGSDARVTVGEFEDGLYVEDDGPGIPEADRDRVFTAGYSTARDGTGFGLSIVKEIVEAHGWTVAVADGPDGGTRFEIAGIQTDQ